jgi:hypothetical protein
MDDDLTFCLAGDQARTPLNLIGRRGDEDCCGADTFADPPR